MSSSFENQSGLSLFGSSINVTLLLDQQGSVSFTNLDEISGRAVVRCAKAITVSSIVLKLEGDSRTRLLGKHQDDRRQDPKIELEHHKILYKTQTIFPPIDVIGARTSHSKSVFTLPAGTHEYPWKFKLPFNNACHTPTTTLPGIQMGMSGRGLEIVKQATRHVKKTLPPTLTGFPGEAEISYFVKVTVQRQGILKENPRAYSPFQFLPIEPPRPMPTGSHVYARHTHTFEPIGKRAGKKAMFGFASTSGEGSHFSIDMRMPEPAILTCAQPIPLSIVVKKLNDCSDTIYLQSLQISLIGSTRIRAHDLERVESNSWIIMSKANMKVTVANSANAVDVETIVDDALWKSVPLPNTVAPSFETCNIARSYEVEVRAGLTYGGATFSGAKPQQVILPLRLKTLVYSGIKPPQEVLTRLAARPNPLERPEEPVEVLDDQKPVAASAQAAPSMPERYDANAEYGDAPPSYEDAMAAELPPVDGYRPAYLPPPVGEDHLLHRDEKRRL